MEQHRSVGSCFSALPFFTLVPSDTARQIYTNITLEKLAFLQHLQSREERWESGMSNWESVAVVRTDAKHVPNGDAYPIR